jgi:hypothetical protein
MAQKPDPHDLNVVYTCTDDNYACSFIWPFRLSTREFTRNQPGADAPRKSKNNA